MVTVTDYELFKLPPRLVCLRVETDTGIVGWGEPTMGAYSNIVKAACEFLMDAFVVGEDPLEINDLWERMYYGGFYYGGPILMTAISGIDHALWDIKGKQYDLPVYEFLGGRVRDRLRVYTTVGEQFVEENPSRDLQDRASTLHDLGVTALKINAPLRTRDIEPPAMVDRTRAQFAAVRDEVGDDVDVAVDFHGRVTPAMVERLADALEPHEPMFIEEPVLPEYNDQLRHVDTSIPLATGGRMYTHKAFADLLGSGVVDVIQPSPSHAGGITAVNKIASLPEAYDVTVAPHSPTGPISYAACLHLGLSAPNVSVQQTPFNVIGASEESLFHQLLDGRPFDYDDGYVTLSSGPGLGIDIDEEFVRQRSKMDIDFQFPLWRHEDGSFARW
ncbi:galactonate dehydratase [Haloplanus halophilus]|uniref:galactonate dehydratase n=1 Tax=Haloplanus halophilus TaxID=2949993 RepID=UPI002042299B|nr:galactonate dehydratase [Haloplanus sp. GDY1]